jgi:hypothetical protein
MRQIPLSNSDQVALVDDEDHPFVSQYRWWLSNNGYAVRTKPRSEPGRRGVILMHRELLGVEPHQIADHINGNRLDNRRENLRRATDAENKLNTGKPSHRPMTSRYKGVVYVPRVRRWRAVIKANRKQRHLGYFKEEREAALAYNAAARELFGEFARLNEVTP